MPCICVTLWKRPNLYRLPYGRIGARSPPFAHAAPFRCRQYRAERRRGTHLLSLSTLIRICRRKDLDMSMRKSFAIAMAALMAASAVQPAFGQGRALGRERNEAYRNGYDDGYREGSRDAYRQGYED